jgi:hypothetical protein
MKTKTMTKWIGAGLLLSAVCMTGKAARASECGMGNDIDWYAGERVKVSDAASLLDLGEERQAAWIIQSTWPRMHEARPMTGSLRHIAEAVRVMAIACVRSGGDVRSGQGWSSNTAGERAANVRWGLSRLQMLTDATPDDALLKVDLAEALSRSPATEGRAKEMLESLTTSGIMLTPEAFAALARLRLASGDEAGAAAAVEQCATLTPVFDRCSPVTPESPAPTASR